MQVRYVESYDDAKPEDADKIALLIEHEHYPQHYVTLEQLMELRHEIDRFLFLQLSQRRSCSHG